MRASKDSYQRQRRQRDENRENILKIIHDSTKTDAKGTVIEGAIFTQIQKGTLLSSAGLTNILQKMEGKEIEKVLIKREKILEKEQVYTNGEVKPAKKLVKKSSVYVLTERGLAQYKGIWLLMHTLLDLKDEGAAYLGGLHSSLWETDPKPLPYIAVHDVAYPSGLENYLNTVHIQDSAEKALVRSIFGELARTDLKKIPDAAKSIFAFEVDWGNYTKFFASVRRFISDVKSDTNLFGDPELEFKTSETNKLELLESYLDKCDMFPVDEEYKEQLRQLLKSPKFITQLISFGAWSNLLNQSTLESVIKMFKQGEDPLLDKKLISKLIIKADKGFYVPLYDYVIIARILNHDDEELSEKLRLYETENKNRPDKSLVFKIQNEMRGKRK
jgi:hypothetical protein